MRPNPLLFRVYFLRGALIWAITKAAITGALLFVGGNALLLPTSLSFKIVLLVVALGWIETRRHRESALLANLGVSPIMLSSVFAGPAVLGEVLLRIGASVFA